MNLIERKEQGIGRGGTGNGERGIFKMGEYLEAGIFKTGIFKSCNILNSVKMSRKFSDIFFQLAIYDSMAQPLPIHVNQNMFLIYIILNYCQCIKCTNLF